jgi:hypothetical protein
MVPIMAAAHNDPTDIESRNNLRADAGLPLLDVSAEGARLRAARGQAEFEEAFRITLRKKIEEGRAGCR